MSQDTALVLVVLLVGILNISRTLRKVNERTDEIKLDIKTTEIRLQQLVEAEKKLLKHRSRLLLKLGGIGK